MERATNIPRTRSSSLSKSTSHSHGQNHERKKTARRMEECTATGSRTGRGRGRRSGLSAGLVLLSAVLALSNLIVPATARTIAYCSSVNTGSDYDSVISEFQSHGLCYDNCNTGTYAFAIVQGSYCWCSNYVPGTDESVSDCSQDCPGYPDDKCGDTQANLYGYMTLSNKPSGTKGAETTVSTTSTIPKTTSPTIPKTSTIIQVGPITTLFITTSATTTKTATTSTTQASTLTTKTTSSKTTSTSASGVTVTVGGTTIVSTPTASPTPNDSTSSKDSNFFSNAGRAAGLIIGIILALAFIVGGVLFWRRRRQQQHAELYGGPGSPAGGIPPGGAGVFGGIGAKTRTRSMSTLGLVGEKGMHSPTGAATTASPATAGETTPGTVYDQRLDPSSLFMRFDHQTGSSRMSVRSLRDDTDYTRRVLRLANPDDS
ncbi:hypothetical protein BZA05DRAFT_441988 [Tricharina praecox]|uniref:uncharacterized protein n=1 Tax=Tricharina praecox TaxID=43433 RepID=UPI00221FE36C|nr:uncharacterized protein BZA05DRAFT_441988 [Tricharina praecox]KAI5856309.1 hypothetical protein BZA05DRAFT_441988 [Tricharina praecox]